MHCFETMTLAEFPYPEGAFVQARDGRILQVVARDGVAFYGCCPGHADNGYFPQVENGRLTDPAVPAPDRIPDGEPCPYSSWPFNQPIIQEHHR